MQSQEIDYSLKWYVMAAVGMSIFLSTIDISIVNVALPTLIEALDTDFPTLQWVVLGYLLAQTTFLLSMGRLGDMIGKKPIYTTGFVIFTIGSVLCGLAPTVYWLIAFRVVQAVGASMLLALGMAIVTEAFPPAERGKALGIIGSIVSIGIVLGPTLGGIIIEALSWHWIFFVNLPVGIIGIFMCIRYVPNFKPSGQQRFDYFGGVTLFVGLLALLLALTLGQGLGFTANLVLLLFGVSIVFLIAFLAIEWNIDQPMVDLRLFKNRLFSINLITGFITFVAVSGMFILLPFYLENVLGFSTRDVGLLLAIVPVFLGITAPIAGSLSDRFGTRPISIIGLISLIIGYFAMTTISTDTSAVGYILRMTPIGIGMGIFQSPNNSAIMGSAPRSQLGVASGLLSITRTLGQVVGIAVLGAFWASRVFYYSGTVLEEGATAAPIAAQAGGLQDIFMANAIMIIVALCISLWGLMQERKLQNLTPSQAHS